MRVECGTNVKQMIARRMKNAGPKNCWTCEMRRGVVRMRTTYQLANANKYESTVDSNVT